MSFSENKTRCETLRRRQSDLLSPAEATSSFGHSMRNRAVCRQEGGRSSGGMILLGSSMPGNGARWLLPALPKHARVQTIISAGFQDTQTEATKTPFQCHQTISRPIFHQSTETRSFCLKEALNEKQSRRRSLIENRSEGQSRGQCLTGQLQASVCGGGPLQRRRLRTVRHLAVKGVGLSVQHGQSEPQPLGVRLGPDTKTRAQP